MCGLLKLDGVKVGIVKLDLKNYGLAAKSGDCAVILKADSLVDRVAEYLDRAEALVTALEGEISVTACRC